MSNPHPVLAADLARSGIEEMRHRRLLVKCPLVFLKSFHFNETDAAITDGMVIAIAVRFLDDDFVLETAHVRGNVEDGGIAAPRDAGRGSDDHRRSRAGGH